MQLNYKSKGRQIIKSQPISWTYKNSCCSSYWFLLHSCPPKVYYPQTVRVILFKFNTDYVIPMRGKRIKPSVAITTSLVLKLLTTRLCDLVSPSIQSLFPPRPLPLLYVYSMDTNFLFFRETKCLSPLIHCISCALLSAIS